MAERTSAPHPSPLSPLFHLPPLPSPSSSLSPLPSPLSSPSTPYPLPSRGTRLCTSRDHFDSARGESSTIIGLYIGLRLQSDTPYPGAKNSCDSVIQKFTWSSIMKALYVLFCVAVSLIAVRSFSYSEEDGFSLRTHGRRNLRSSHESERFVHLKQLIKDMYSSTIATSTSKEKRHHAKTLLKVSIAHSYFVSTSHLCFFKFIIHSNILTQYTSGDQNNCRWYSCRKVGGI